MRTALLAIAAVVLVGWSCEPADPNPGARGGSRLLLSPTVDPRCWHDPGGALCCVYESREVWCSSMAI